MSKKPLTEGHVRCMQKGFNKSNQSANVKPTQPPPRPSPSSLPSKTEDSQSIVLPESLYSELIREAEREGVSFDIYIVYLLSKRNKEI